MRSIIPEPVKRLFRDRRSLLWVCQGYDLLPGEEPHEYDLPEAEAALRYRPEPNEVDHLLASLFWEAIWFEGAKSPLLTSIRAAAERQSLTKRRSVVTLASESDARAEFSSQEFLTCSILPGAIGESASQDGRYGMVRRRLRERIAWSLAERIANFPGRALIVLGANRQSDLAQLYEVLESRPIKSLDILLIWPPTEAAPSSPENPSVNIHVWDGDIGGLLDALGEAGAPTSGDLPQWTIRIRNRQIRCSARDVHRVLKRFALVTERDLIPPAKFTVEDLHDFLSGSLGNWASYGAGLPVQRTYRSERGLSLAEEAESALSHLESDGHGLKTFTLELPCEGGSGATTLLRHAAFELALKGYPTLILRPEQADVEVDDLGAFATSLNELALAGGITDVPPLVIVLDVEHEQVARRSYIPQVLAARGRKALILRASSLEDNKSKEMRGRQYARLLPLLASIGTGEAELCETAFRTIVGQWNLQLTIPSLDQWRSYENVMRWHTPGSSETASPLFWVALRYFLTEGMDISDAYRARDLLATWISRRSQMIVDPKMQAFVANIAALSAFRIVSPLWTVMRPVTGGSFTSQLSDTLRQIKDLVEWCDYSEVLEDQILRFTHPVLADEYLRRIGVTSTSEKVALLAPLLNGLSQGSAGDVWVAESLVVSLVPTFHERQSTDWESSLQVFDKIPPVVRDNSKLILHHWARCLYQCADQRNVPHATLGQRGERFEMAIDRLRRAVDLPRRPGRGEHPSHLYNTLGTAYSRHAQFLRDEIMDPIAEDEAWRAACEAFSKSIDLSGGVNIEAFLAFGQRLLTHANRVPGLSTSHHAIEDVTQALSLFDIAEDLLEEYENPDEKWKEDLTTYRAHALRLLNAEASKEFVETLKRSETPALGFYVEARLVLAESLDENRIRQGLEILTSAESAGIRLDNRAVSLRISLMMKLREERYNFPVLLELYRRLESDRRLESRALDAFRHAVLCYQVGHYAEGSERFRVLRERWRRSSAVPLRVKDIWRDPSAPERARVTYVRVSRVVTEWRAEGFIDDLKQTVPLRPRHFDPPPRENEIRPCVVRFELNGPLAVPERFEHAR